MTADVATDEDWPGHPEKRQLLELDRSSQCGICHDFFDAPLSLLCGHSFCSECLRSNIQFQERSCGKVVCPQCRQPADSRQVVANHALRDLVKHYLLARPHLILSVKGTNPHSASEEKIVAQPRARKKRRRVAEKDAEVINLDSSPERDVAPRKLRNREKPVDYFPKLLPGVEEADGNESAENEEADVDDQESKGSQSSASSPSPIKKPRSSAGKHQPPLRAHRPPPNWVECPICAQHFPLAIFNDHLDRCLESGGKGKDARGSGARRTRLIVPPKLLLAIEKDKSLKERLKKYNLSTKGTRQDLEQRYNRFRVEVQTAIDRCEVAATYASLARRVMTRESNASTAATNGLAVKSGFGKSSGPTGGSNNFDDLIRATKQRVDDKDKSFRQEEDVDGAEKRPREAEEPALRGVGEFVSEDKAPEPTAKPTASTVRSRRFGGPPAAKKMADAQLRQKEHVEEPENEDRHRSSSVASVVPETEAATSSRPGSSLLDSSFREAPAANADGAQYGSSRLRKDGRAEEEGLPSDIIEDSDREFQGWGSDLDH